MVQDRIHPDIASGTLPYLPPDDWHRGPVHVLFIHSSPPSLAGLVGFFHLQETP